MNYRLNITKAILLATLTIVVTVAGQTSAARWQHWQSSQLKGYAKKLAPKIDAQKVASESLGKYNNHSMLVSHREGDGLAELHEKQADVFFVESGEGAVVIGGEMVDAKPSAPGEMRGSSITDGEKRELKRGDIVHISAGVPHQFLVKAGKELTCVFVKVDETK